MPQLRKPKTIDDVLDDMEWRRACVGSGSWRLNQRLADGMKMRCVDNDEDLSDTKREYISCR